MKNLLFVLVVLFISSCKKQETSVIVKPTIVKSVKTPQTIFVIPMGKTSNFDVNYTVNELKQFYKCNVKVLPKVETLNKLFCPPAYALSVDNPTIEYTPFGKNLVSFLSILL